MKRITSVVLLENVGKPCPYCGETMLNHPDYPDRQPSRDHIKPRGHRVRGQFAPIVVTCHRCNQDKGGHRIENWQVLLFQAGDPRAEHVLNFIKAGCPPTLHPAPAKHVVDQRGLMQRLYEHFERVDPRPKQYIRYEWTPHGLASHPVDDREEGRRADLDDAGRRGDPTE